MTFIKNCYNYVNNFYRNKDNGSSNSTMNWHVRDIPIWLILRWLYLQWTRSFSVFRLGFLWKRYSIKLTLKLSPQASCFGKIYIALIIATFNYVMKLSASSFYSLERRPKLFYCSPQIFYLFIYFLNSLFSSIIHHSRKRKKEKKDMLDCLIVRSQEYLITEILYQIIEFRGNAWVGLIFF